MVSDRFVRGVFGVVTVLALTLGPLVAAAQSPKDPDAITRELQSLAWQRGPTDGRIGGTATLKVREGEAFLDGPNTRRFLELNQNPPRDHHYTLASDNGDWFAVFYFDESGYVRDDEKLDSDALLNALKGGDERGNEERKKLGMAPLHTEGWHVPPHYDLSTKRLEWGVRLRADRGPIINYTIRLLGRRGVMQATLVSAPGSLDRDIKDFKASLAGFDFVAGERYAEFKSGDRVAEYGLAALVLGGAAAVATKTGFGKAIGKFLIIGAVALGGAILAFFRKIFRRS
jgi:uncharacterized membrane-anchored protein